MNQKKAWKIVGFSVLGIVVIYLFLVVVGISQFVTSVKP
ncbi:hypothetical protein JOD82_002093 [Paenibacillus sp. 1182]|nr:hypothetical protein [Paenibacillus sp. 1182]